MKKSLSSLALITLLSAPAAADSLRVIDGDTFILRGTHIRVWGLDCPERDTPSGVRATQAARTLLEPNRVILGELHGMSYKREVRQVHIQRTSRAEFFTFDFACMMIFLGVCSEAIHFTQGYYARCKS